VSWHANFLREALHERETLQENGAEPALVGCPPLCSPPLNASVFQERKGCAEHHLLIATESARSK
jgi:hypothetical protein